MCLLAGAAAAGDGSERGLLEAWLASPAVSAQVDAMGLRARAEATGPALLPNPELEARREVARGSAGATTEAVGGALSVDLGLAAQAERHAARLWGDAARAHAEAELLEGACALREEVTALDAAWRALVIRQLAHARLRELHAHLVARAEAGEDAAYDLDRAALGLAVHANTLRATQAESAALEASVKALVGVHVDALMLADWPPLPKVEEARAVALSDHPELRALRSARDAAAYERAAARRATAPDLRLSAGVRWDAPPEGGPATQGYEVGGAVELPLFDWSSASRRQSAASWAELDARVQQAERDRLAAVDAAWQRAATLGVDAGASLGERTWSAAWARFEGGEADIEELLAVAAAVEQASLSALDAATQARGARLTLDCAVGRFSDIGMNTLMEERLR